ncbi:MAG: GspH/FimT family pseudopilin [Gammaproteobacteria bacterium]
MNLLECIVTLAISAIVSCLAFSYWDNLIASYAVNQDAHILAKTFKSTQIRAMASHQTTRLCGDEHCTAPLGDNIVVVPDVGNTYHTALSGKTHLITRAFPASKNNQFVFTPQGMTDFQNASIYVCSNTSPVARQLRINQAGRVIVDEENVFEEC